MTQGKPLILDQLGQLVRDGEPRNDPWQPYAPIARTVREVELNRLLTLALPYLIAQQMTDTGDKLAELVAAIVLEMT